LGYFDILFCDLSGKKQSGGLYEKAIEQEEYFKKCSLTRTVIFFLLPNYYPKIAGIRNSLLTTGVFICIIGVFCIKTEFFYIGIIVYARKKN
jgi:hypothetical protein